MHTVNTNRDRITLVDSIVDCRRFLIRRGKNGNSKHKFFKRETRFVGDIFLKRKKKTSKYNFVEEEEKHESIRD